MILEIFYVIASLVGLLLLALIAIKLGDISFQLSKHNEPFELNEKELGLLRETLSDKVPVNPASPVFSNYEPQGRVVVDEEELVGLKKDDPLFEPVKALPPNEYLVSNIPQPVERRSDDFPARPRGMQNIVQGKS